MFELIELIDPAHNWLDDVPAAFAAAAAAAAPPIRAEQAATADIHKPLMAHDRSTWEPLATLHRTTIGEHQRCLNHAKSKVNAQAKVRKPYKSARKSNIHVMKLQ